MSTAITPHKTIEDVERLFKTWRRTRKHYKPIPAELWEAALNLTTDYSIPTIAKRLLLNPAELKRRALATCTHRPDQQQSAPTFIELDMGGHGISYNYLIEMEDSNGSRMKIQIKDSNHLDLHELCRAFWSKRI